MQRQPEPELMTGEEQARAYAQADFSVPHGRFIELCQARFPGQAMSGPVLDLGCGPGDITFRFARAYPKAHLVGVDGSAAMLALGRANLSREPALQGRVQFIEGIIPEAPIPALPYVAIISNSLLHHLHEPEVLWQTILRQAHPGTLIFIVDLRRPESELAAQRLTDENTRGEPEVLRRDFYHSLLAAFEPEEVRNQLSDAGLSQLAVEAVSDRHMLIWGVRS
jgi:SAM-dependent methyltransferase